MRMTAADDGCGRRVRATGADEQLRATGAEDRCGPQGAGTEVYGGGHGETRVEVSGITERQAGSLIREEESKERKKTSKQAREKTAKYLHDAAVSPRASETRIPKVRTHHPTSHGMWPNDTQ